MDCPAPADRNADLPARQIVDELRRVEVPDVWPHAREEFLGGCTVLGAVAVGIEAEIDERQLKHVGRRIGPRDAALRGR